MKELLIVHVERTADDVVSIVPDHHDGAAASDLPADLQPHANGPMRTSLALPGGVVYADARDADALHAVVDDTVRAGWIAVLFGGAVAAAVDAGETATVKVSDAAHGVRNALAHLLRLLWWRRWAPGDGVDEDLVEAEIGVLATSLAPVLGSTQPASDVLKPLVPALTRRLDTDIDDDVRELVAEAAWAAARVVPDCAAGMLELEAALDRFDDEVDVPMRRPETRVPTHDRPTPVPCDDRARPAVLDPRDIHPRTANSAWWWISGDEVRVVVDTVERSMPAGDGLIASVHTDDGVDAAIPLRAEATGHEGRAMLSGAMPTGVSIWHRDIGMPTRAPRSAPAAGEVRAEIARTLSRWDANDLPRAAALRSILALRMDRYTLAASTGSNLVSRSTTSGGIELRVTSLTGTSVRISVRTEPGVAEPLDVVVVESIDANGAMRVALVLDVADGGRLEGGVTVSTTSPWVDMRLFLPTSLSKLSEHLALAVTQGVAASDPVAVTTWIRAARALPAGHSMRQAVKEGLEQ